MKLAKLVFCAAVFILWGISVFAALDVQFVGNIKQSPNPAAIGNEITFTISFKPAGGAVSNLKITGGIDGTKLFERTYASILADKTKTDSFKWTGTTPNHTVWFELDPGHTCSDSDYSNNKIQTQVSLSGGSGSQYILNENTTGPIRERAKRLGEMLGKQFSDKTDIFVVDVWATDENGNKLGQLKNDQKFKLNCKFRRIGPEPPGTFYVTLWYGGGAKADCTNSSCTGLITDTSKTAVSDKYLVYSSDYGNYPMECMLKWQDPNYKDTDTNNNYMKKMIFVD